MKYIYALIDPRTRGIRYVGQTVSPEQRYTQHVSSTENTPKGVWIQELRSVGLKPDFIILDTTESEDQVNYLETWWILLGRRQGWELTNGTNPGIWRANEDFRIIFADELLHMYDEHRTACERLNAQVISLAVEAERFKWLRRVETAACTILAVFVIVGASYFAMCAWLARTPVMSSLDARAVSAHWLLAATWLCTIGLVYAQWKSRELFEEKPPWLMVGSFAVLDICIILFAISSIYEMGRLFA